MSEDILQIIKNIIDTEDKKNPLTDEEIAVMMNTHREKVTELRLKNNIDDSRERRRQALYKDTEEILKQNIKLSERQLTKILNDKGYKVSRHIVSQVKNELLNKIKNSEYYIENFKEEKSDKVEEDNTAFSKIIGSEGSLKLQISQAKAAVLYPPNGLHTLILGPSGVGKSHIAEAMYKFAVNSGNFKNDAPFIVFNCADYADNPQLLLSQLFGYNKGAFTGADASKPGIVEKADGGILFLDEVHRLPNEGQEILFYLLDKGKFRRMGETESTRTVSIMLIAATTENPESYLLLTFRRRIPMIIEIPSLKERPFHERYEIIKEFFLNESFRVGKAIIIEPDVIRALMLYDSPGNIGQLRSDIQVSCARGFLNSMGSKEEDIRISISDLPNYVRMGIFKVDKKESGAEKYFDRSLIVYPNRSSVFEGKEDRYTLPDNIYQFIEEKFTALNEQGINKDEIDNIIAKQVEIELERFAKNVKHNIIASNKELNELVGDQIVEVTGKAIKIAKENYNVQDNLYYSLAIHLSAAYERLKGGKIIINPQMENVIKEYPLEQRIARRMAEQINEDLGVRLPEEEIAFIAMYLRTFSADKREGEEGKVGVIVLSHGNVATAMAEVANRLLGVNHAVGVKMDLNESVKSTLDKTTNVVRGINEGKGCIILADMGSLLTFGDTITKTTNIPTRTIGRVDTLMVLEAVRRAIMHTSTLDEIYDALKNEEKDSTYRHKETNLKERPKAIVTICITGEGTALKVKKYIEDSLPDIKNNLNIIPVGMMKQKDIEKEINKIMVSNDVVAFVGTINPSVDNIPFISVESVVNGGGINELENIVFKSSRHESSIKDVINEELILPDLKASSKNDVIDTMVNLMYQKGYVDESFMLSVYKRESIISTFSEGGIAIPHGDPVHVIKPAICIARLARPLEWAEPNVVDLVFMMALKEDSKNYFNDLYDVIFSQKSLKALRNAESVESFIDIIYKGTK